MNVSFECRYLLRLYMSTEWDTYGNDLSHDVDRQTTIIKCMHEYVCKCCHR